MVRQIKPKSETVDTVIIGGGAAGLMTAIVAAEAGAKVVLVEKNATLGNKLRITGGGRCNITNNTPQVRTLLSAYKDAGKFLFSPFAQCGVSETLTWLEEHGIATVEEAERRVFPKSQRAVQVTETLIARAEAAGVRIITKCPVVSATYDTNLFTVQLRASTLVATRVVLATGGTSRPETGSTGDALPWLTTLGHTVATPRAVLVPVLVQDTSIVSRLAGIALPTAGITVLQDGTTIAKRTGKVLFTHTGFSGPGILNISSVIKDALPHGAVTIVIDLVPATPADKLEATLLALCIAAPNKLVRNQLATLIPAGLAVLVMEQAGVTLDCVSHSLTVAARRQLVRCLKAVSFAVAGLAGTDKAIVTSGGVALTEIDFRTMQSKRIPGLYVVGDVLDIDRPSGGYSLQLCWTTGFVAGMHIASQQAAIRKDSNDDHEKESRKEN
jgi:predicted Rossmann fold flavoprotein